MAQEEVEELPQSERAKMNTPCQGEQEGTHHGREDNDKQVPDRKFLDPMCLQRRKKDDEEQPRVSGEVQNIRLLHGPWRRLDTNNDTTYDHYQAREKFEGRLFNDGYYRQPHVPQEQKHNVVVCSGPEAEEQEGKLVQKQCVTIMQTLRQGEGCPDTRGKESQWHETSGGANDQHALVVSFGAPTDNLPVCPHCAEPVGANISLERLHSGGGRGDHDGHEHGAHHSHKYRRELSDARTKHRFPMEDHHVQDVEGYHAHGENDASEGIGNVPMQGRCRHDEAEIQDLQPEVQQRRHLEYRRERLWPRHGQ